MNTIIKTDSAKFELLGHKYYSKWGNSDDTYCYAWIYRLKESKRKILVSMVKDEEGFDVLIDCENNFVSHHVDEYAIIYDTLEKAINGIEKGLHTVNDSDSPIGIDVNLVNRGINYHMKQMSLPLEPHSFSIA